MKKKICIRAEGGANIGMGHVMRMLELARQLKKYGEEVFFLSKLDKANLKKYQSGIDYIKNNQFDVVLVDTRNFWEEIKKVSADIFITDSYDVDDEYFTRIKQVFPISGYMDDEGICSYFDVDFIINQNPYADKIKYKANPASDYLLGTNYLILRDEFIGKRYDIRKNIKNVMLTLGGSDDNNLTEEIIMNLLPGNYNLRVVVGSAFLHADKLKKYENEKIQLFRNACMSEIMSWADVVITSCGTTAYEVASMGVPAIGIAVVDNQEMCAQKMQDMGVMKISHDGNYLSLIKTLDYDCRMDMYQRAAHFIDGLGKERLASYISVL